MLFTSMLLQRTCGTIRSYSPLLRFIPEVTPRLRYQVSHSNILNPTTKFLILGRSNSTGKNFSNQKIASKFRQMDGIPNNYELIYRVNFPSYLIAIQVVNLFGILSVTFVFLGLLLQYNVDKKSPEGDNPKGLPPQLGAMEPYERSDERLPTPHFDELRDFSWESTGIVVLTLFGLSVALIKLQRTLPIRLYTSSSRHCYAVFYGHIIPSRTTKREFVAGTLKSPESGKSFLSKGIYEDPTGRQMILLDYNFRLPSDLNFLLGIKNHLHDDDEESRNTR